MKNILITFLFISVFLSGSAFSKDIVVNGLIAQRLIAEGEILSIDYENMVNGARYDLLVKNFDSIYVCEVSKEFVGALLLNTVCYRDDSN